MSPQQWLILGFLTALGGCLGSFLNVVVYRWPRGNSVVRPGSRCPHCDHPIRPIHNIPVFSWLILRGRCRDCQGPISSRYALVEGLIALAFLGLGLNIFHNVDELSLNPMNDPARWSLFACQAVIVCCLACAYLIRRDGFPVPKVLYLAIFLAIVGAGVIMSMEFFRLGS